MMYAVTKLYPNGMASAPLSVEAKSVQYAKAVASRFAGSICAEITLELREHNGSVVAVRVRGKWLDK